MIGYRLRSQGHLKRRFSLSVVIVDAAHAFRRFAPMALADLWTHAQLAHNASYQVTIATREAYMHQLPWMRVQYSP